MKPIAREKIQRMYKRTQTIWIEQAASFDFSFALSGCGGLGMGSATSFSVRQD
jgi:hypothetical protein